jgi:hypothetical protein
MINPSSPALVGKAPNTHPVLPTTFKLFTPAYQYPPVAVERLIDNQSVFTTVPAVLVSVNAAVLVEVIATLLAEPVPDNVKASQVVVVPAVNCIVDGRPVAVMFAKRLLPVMVSCDVVYWFNVP